MFLETLLNMNLSSKERQLTTERLVLTVPSIDRIRTETLISKFTLLSQHLLGRTEKNNGKSQDSVSAEIRTGHLPNICQKLDQTHPIYTCKAQCFGNGFYFRLQVDRITRNSIRTGYLVRILVVKSRSVQGLNEVEISPYPVRPKTEMELIS
jgi:hypothetical protein